jgi:hypothetical protein
MTMHEGALGRKPPTDNRHLVRYSLTTDTMPTKPTPVVLGVNWYSAFDNPLERADRYWLPTVQATWGRVRGGHAICLLPPSLVDPVAWWRFYNQWAEGACVGFAIARMMTLLNRRRYNARWVYHQALRIDEWPGEADEGTSVRAGCDVARELGMVRVGLYEDALPEHSDGIDANRWARSVEEIAACLSPADDGKRVLDRGYVTMLNSWGDSYPHHVRIPLDALDRLVFAEYGDAVVVTDR